MDSTVSKLNKYINAIQLDDFIDFLYSQRVIDESDYYAIQPRRDKDRLHELFKIIDSKTDEDHEIVLQYLKDTYPNNEKFIEEERKFRESSVRGGFPKLPPNYVTRSGLVEDVKKKLLDLQWDRTLVIHGMMGYGKSCLINEVLSDRTVRKYFDNFLFWIKLGDCHTKEDVLLPMCRLFAAANSVVDNKISHSYDDVETLKELLIKLFLDSRLNNSVIILDDACSDDVLTYFDIGCKTVVTTQNKNILKKEEAVFVEVKTGFSLTESIELFKKSLNFNHDLPASAEEIHNICQGHPMLIALIGSYLSENGDCVRAGENEIWQYIKNMFLRGNYRLNEYDNEVDIPKIIKKCIEKLLTNNLKELYQDLAIFEQDVNIPPEVLKVLWNKSLFEVRNIMYKFAEKSLIVPFYHNDLKTYIYGIHDIHLNYLKELARDRTVSLHKKLISGYDRITNGNYANLPNDNYTLQFIGYHLYHAKAFDKFYIYFDLKFLELKIKAVGKEDVLRDMHKYKSCIAQEDNLLIEKLEQYKDFINRCGGNLYSYEKTDIIQYGLRENKDTFVFKEALKLAKLSPHLYFQLQRPVDELDYSQIINIKDDITVACFVNSSQHILYGTADGKIKLIYEQKEKEISNFVGHCGSITSLIVSPDRGYFLSVSEDGTVLLWKFAADSSRNSRDFSAEIPISPKTKQAHWLSMHTPDKGQISPQKTFRATENDDFLISAAFCSDFPLTFRIVTGSNRGNVIVWDAQTETQLCKTGQRGFKTPCVLYLEWEKMDVVMFSCEDSVYMYELKDEKLIYYEVLYNNVNCDWLFVSNEKIIAVSEKNINIWQKHKRNNAYEIIDYDKYNICSTLDEQYLVVSTNQSTVYVWDIEGRKLVREFENKGLAKSLDTFYDEDKSVHILLIGSDKKTLQQCHIQSYDKEPQVENVPVVPHWKRKNAITAIVSGDNRIQVFSGYIMISETKIITSQVTYCCFTVCGNNVVYGLRNGEIHLFHLRNKSYVQLEKTWDGPITYLKCYDPSHRSKSTSSVGSNDSLDNIDLNFGIIVAVSNNNLVAVYSDDCVYTNNIPEPVIFFKSDHLIITDKTCQIYMWNLKGDAFFKVNNPLILEPVKRSSAAFCCYKSLLAICYQQENLYFLDVYSFVDDNRTAELSQRITSDVRAKCLQFSTDGALLAAGLTSGDIRVWNLNKKYKSVMLSLHSDPVEHLIFSPNLEPILVSLGDDIAWWNLKSFQKISEGNRPRCINILDSVTDEFEIMNFSLWADKKPLIGTEYLLSSIKLQSRAKYISASNDFNSFLTIDDNGKVYIMEVIQSDS